MENNLITVRLKGGLGNYLFQIATGYSLSKQYNDDFCVDLSDVIVIHKPVQHYFNALFKNIRFSEQPHIQTYYQEPFFQYSPIPHQNNLKIEGYFQTEKYFINYRKDIIELLDFETIQQQIKPKYDLVNTCSIHVRRGDYLTKPNYHPTCDISYYNKAINLMPPNTRFLIFSDDILWCKTQFIGNNFNFIDELNDYEDLALMSLCEHNIIANSSFSWWGAWLNENPNKIVIAPNRWFGVLVNNNTQDLIPNLWTKI